MPPLKSDEKDVSIISYNEISTELRERLKKDLEDIKNQINLANYDLAMLRDRKIKENNDLESWKRAERLRYTNEFTQKQNDIIANQNRINMEVQQQERITGDLRTQQTKFEGLRAEQIKLKEELVKLEGKKIEVADMLKQAEVRLTESLNSQNQGSMALAKAAEEAEKTKQENIRLEALNDSLSKREKKLEEDIKNAQDLKDFVEPKIRDIKIQQEHLDASIMQNTAEIARLQQTMNDEKILLQSIMDRKAAVEKAESELISKKQEFDREQLLSKGV